MKILYFSRDYTNHDHRWLQALSDADYQVRFLRLERAGSNLDQRALPPGVTEIEWSGGQTPFDWQQADKLQSELKTILDVEQADILHAGPLNTASVLAARSGFHPLVQMSWGSDILRFAEDNQDERARVQESLNAADALIGDCQAVRQAAVNMGMLDEAIVAFPWGIDIDRFSPGEASLRSALGWNNDFVMLHTRALESDYGVASVIEGFIQTAQKEPRLRLILAGDGSLRKSIADTIKENGLEERVHFTGHLAQSQQPDLFRSADVYVSGTYSDGSSVSLMEALASGIPALVSDIPGNREWVFEGQQGWLFPAGDAAVLAEKLLVVANTDEQALQTMANHARTQAHNKADWSKNQLNIPSAYAIAQQRASKALVQ